MTTSDFERDFSHAEHSIAAFIPALESMRTDGWARGVVDTIAKQLNLPAEFPSLSFFEKALKTPSNIKEDATKDLYGAAANPKDSVVADACVQPYGIGNCYFVAAMASLAKTNPQAILDMIKVNDDGTYTVKFPGANKSVDVSKPTAAEFEQVGGKSKYGDWPLVMMKAYGKYCGGGKTDIEGSDGGSLLSAGLKVLSGNGVVNEGLGYMLPIMTWKSMDSELKAALKPENPKDALPVTASTAKSLFSDKTTDGFVRSHVYSVLDYKPDLANIKQGKVTVRNPYGGADATREISLEQFYGNFIQLSIPNR